MFCNARQDAFGVCAYLRQEFEDNVVECRLVAGKGLVAPLKAQSLCRLELMRALIAARLSQTLAAEFMTKIEKITFGVILPPFPIGFTRRAPTTRHSWVIKYRRFT